MTLQSVKSYLDTNNITYRPESGGKELRINCPFCHHENNKCYVNADTGEFWCFHCGNGGIFSTLLRTLKIAGDVTEIEKRELPTDYELPFVDKSLVEMQHASLLHYLQTLPQMADYFYKKRGLSLETIKKFKLGWDNKHITIPIFTTNGDCAYIKRKFDPTSPSTIHKNLITPKGANKRLFNEEVLQKKQERVIIAEGEWDCMLLDQYGYASVTSTAGANSFSPEWTEAFARAEKIYIAYDNDRNGTGQKGAEKVAQLFFNKGIRVFLVKLPLLRHDEEKLDITDFFQKRGKRKEDFTQLLKDSVEFNGTDFKTPLLTFISGKEFLGMEFEEQKWLVDNFILSSGMSVLSGIEGSYKSWLSLYLAQCVSEGKPFFDKWETARGNVLIIDKENTKATLHERMRLLGISPTENIYLLGKGEFWADKVEEMQGTLAFVRDHDIKLVIIDTLIRVHGANENDASEMSKVLEKIGLFTQEEAAVLLLHHLKKPTLGASQSLRDLLRGTTDISAKIDTHFSISKMEHLLKIEFGKNRTAKMLPPFLVEFISSEKDCKFEFVKELESVESKVKSLILEDEILAMLESGSMTRKGIVNAFGPNISASSIDRVLKNLKEQNKISVFRNGEGSFYTKNNLTNFINDKETE